MLPCWHNVGKMWHSFIQGRPIALCRECSITNMSEQEWLTSGCSPSVDPKTMLVCDKCFREYCVEVIGY